MAVYFIFHFYIIKKYTYPAKLDSRRTG